MKESLDKPPSPKRGRIAHATYVRAVGKMLTRTWDVLDTCDILTQLEIVRHFCTVNPKKYPTPGFAVRALLDLAIDQIIQATMDSTNESTKRIAFYLGYRVEGKSVSFIADKMGLTREYVTRSVGHQAAVLVTERVLKIGQRKLVAYEPEKAVAPSSIEQPQVFRRTGFRKG